jgi:hypothetical protein
MVPSGNRSITTPRGAALACGITVGVAVGAGVGSGAFMPGLYLCTTSCQAAEHLIFNIIFNIF